MVVDYKSDSWRTEADLDAKADRYRVQLAAYAHMVGQVTGESVTRAILLHLGPKGAVERVVDVGSVDITALADAFDLAR